METHTITVVRHVRLRFVVHPRSDRFGFQRCPDIIVRCNHGTNNTGNTGPAPPGGHGPPLFCEASSFRATVKGVRSLGSLFFSLAPPPTFKFLARANNASANMIINQVFTGRKVMFCIIDL